MELRSGRILPQIVVAVAVRTVFKNDEERKSYLCDVIKDLMDQCEAARGVEKKIYYAGQVYKIMLAHKDFIWTYPAFKNFKNAVTNKAKEIKIEIAEKIADGQLSPENPIYKDAMIYLEAF
jgi:hypothetical protein